MFDFFDEIAEFLSQVVDNFNSFQMFMQNSILSFGDALEWIRNFNENLPEKFAWILPLVMLFMVFDYIRGRG